MGDLLTFGSTSLFGCLDDIVVCIIVALIPCYQGGLNKAKADERVCLCSFFDLARNGFSVND